MTPKLLAGTPRYLDTSKYAWLRDNFRPVDVIAYTYPVFEVTPRRFDEAVYWNKVHPLACAHVSASSAWPSNDRAQSDPRIVRSRQASRCQRHVSKRLGDAGQDRQSGSKPDRFHTTTRQGRPLGWTRTVISSDGI